MTPLQSEQQDSDRLKKAVEFVNHCKTVEAEARKALARAIDQTTLAREKHTALFLECERRAVLRRKQGLIETKID